MTTTLQTDSPDFSMQDRELMFVIATEEQGWLF
jgi:hypothetical protein